MEVVVERSKNGTLFGRFPILCLLFAYMTCYVNACWALVACLGGQVFPCHLNVLKLSTTHLRLNKQLERLQTARGCRGQGIL